MSLIEQATKRLEALRRAGIEIPAPHTENVNGIRMQSTANKSDHATDASTSSSIDTSKLLSGLASSNTTAKTAPTPSTQMKLDFNKLAANGFTTPDMPRSQVADEFRIIKRMLLGNAKATRMPPIKNGNLIMVTSSLPGEGKTFSAVNLAMSIAMELDRTVLLVDADVARPSLPQLLGLPPSKGLLDVLDKSVNDVSEILIRTNVDKLSILSSGTYHPKATELLASEQMTRLLDEMANRYSDRIIVFDSPPLLVTTEARVLATHMGQIAFVVNAETTLRSDVALALSTIEACPVKLMLLNKARSSSSGSYGYGYQAYGT